MYYEGMFCSILNGQHSLQQCHKLWIILYHFGIPWKDFIQKLKTAIIVGEKKSTVTVQMEVSLLSYHSETIEFLNGI